MNRTNARRCELQLIFCCCCCHSNSNVFYVQHILPLSGDEFEIKNFTPLTNLNNVPTWCVFAFIFLVFFSDINMQCDKMQNEIPCPRHFARHLNVVFIKSVISFQEVSSKYTISRCGIESVASHRNCLSLAIIRDILQVCFIRCLVY